MRGEASKKLCLWAIGGQGQFKCKQEDELRLTYALWPFIPFDETIAYTMLYDPFIAFYKCQFIDKSNSIFFNNFLELSRTIWGCLWSYADQMDALGQRKPILFLRAVTHTNPRAWP